MAKRFKTLSNLGFALAGLAFGAEHVTSGSLLLWHPDSLRAERSAKKAVLAGYAARAQAASNTTDHVAPLRRYHLLSEAPAAQAMRLSAWSPAAVQGDRLEFVSIEISPWSREVGRLLASLESCLESRLLWAERATGDVIDAIEHEFLHVGDKLYFLTENPSALKARFWAPKSMLA